MRPTHFDPFDDVAQHRAADLASMLVAHARVHLAAAVAEAEEMHMAAIGAAERLEHALAQLHLWSECLEDAVRSRAEADTLR